LIKRFHTILADPPYYPAFRAAAIPGALSFNCYLRTGGRAGGAINRSISPGNLQLSAPFDHL
jgi:hypothetical protein